MDNTSGQGKSAGVPEEVRGISWGAFWWTFIWGIFNRVWFSFLVFVPVVGFFAWLILLFKGRQWAWQNKRWDSVEHFNSVQRKWGLSGLIVMAAVVALSVAAVFMGVFLGGGERPVTAGKASPPPAAAKAVADPVVRPAAPPIQPAAAAPIAVKPAVAPAAVKPATAPETKPAAAVKTKPAAVARAAVKKAPAAPPARPSVAKSESPVAEPGTPRTVVMDTPPVFAGPAPANPSFNDLMTAVLYRNGAGVNELLALGKWPDKPDSVGTTPLMAAVMLGDAENAERLLKAGANPNASARGGSTAVSLARERKDGAMTALLRRYGAP